MQTALRQPVRELDFGTNSEVAVDLSAEDVALLAHLRVVSLACRTSSRDDLFEACALLAMDQTDCKDAHAKALMRCLAQALGKRPKLFRPGVTQVSFDEAWLLRLAGAVRTSDDASLMFLLRSRVPAQWHRNFTFLIRAVVERFF